MDVVTSVLEKAAREEKLKSTEVQKHLELEIDEGHLLAVDYNAFDAHRLKTQTDAYLKRLTRENVQLVINKIWELPTERVEEAIVAKLPQPRLPLPRTQRVPKPKALTKWQQFAKEKGISGNKKKKSKLSWDDELQKWVPTYGYRRAEADTQKEWLIEMGDNVKPTEDLFEKKATVKREKQAKNELQRLRNLARAKNIKVPRVGITNSDYYRDTKQISTAVTVARSSTASVGKFQNRLPKEKDARNIREMVPGTKKKKKQPMLKPREETKQNLGFADNILSRRPTIVLPNIEPPAESATPRAEAGRKKGAKTFKKGAKKPKAGKGKRDMHTKVGGRKRRQKN